MTQMKGKYSPSRQLSSSFIFMQLCSILKFASGGKVWCTVIFHWFHRNQSRGVVFHASSSCKQIIVTNVYFYIAEQDESGRVLRAAKKKHRMTHGVMGKVVSLTAIMPSKTIESRIISANQNSSHRNQKLCCHFCCAAIFPLWWRSLKYNFCF